jgi:glycerophosphoryl diester phosphodiesterase
VRELFRPTAKPLPFVSAHRGGGRKGFPENCLATFEDTLRHTPAMMAIDPRFTKDGAIAVLDQKDVPLATRVGKITERQAEAFATVIVNSFNPPRARGD